MRDRRARTSGGAAPTWLRWVTRVSLVAGAAALVVTVHMVGPGVLMRHLLSIGPWFGALLAIELVITLCDAATLYAMTRGPRAPTFRQVCVAQFAGRAVASVTPGAALGDALRVSLLARTSSTPRIVAAVVFAALGTLVTGLAIVAAGTLATALLYTLPIAAELVLLATGMLAAGIAAGTVVIVRRGMLTSLAQGARRVRLIGDARFERWRERLADVDRRLRGDTQAEHRTIAIVLIVISQLLGRAVIWVALLAAGFALGPAQLIAVLSAGLLLTWISALVPMGLGIAEGGHGVLFAAIGAPPSLGVALALARRVNQIVFAVIGFAVLGIDRLVHHVTTEDVGPREVTR